MILTIEKFKYSVCEFSNVRILSGEITLYNSEDVDLLALDTMELTLKLEEKYPEEFDKILNAQLTIIEKTVTDEVILNIIKDRFKMKNRIILEIQEESREEGEKIGIKKEQNRIAKNMLKKKIPHNIISQCTGLSLETLLILK